jgi:hypothetical protein
MADRTRGRIAIVIGPAAGQGLPEEFAREHADCGSVRRPTSSRSRIFGPSRQSNEDEGS